MWLAHCWDAWRMFLQLTPSSHLLPQTTPAFPKKKANRHGNPLFPQLVTWHLSPPRHFHWFIGFADVVLKNIWHLLQVKNKVEAIASDWPTVWYLCYHPVVFKASPCYVITPLFRSLYSFYAATVMGTRFQDLILDVEQKGSITPHPLLPPR